MYSDYGCWGIPWKAISAFPIIISSEWLKSKYFLITNFLCPQFLPFDIRDTERLLNPFDCGFFVWRIKKSLGKEDFWSGIKKLNSWFSEKNRSTPAERWQLVEEKTIQGWRDASFLGHQWSWILLVLQLSALRFVKWWSHDKLTTLLFQPHLNPREF